MIAYLLAVFAAYRIARILSMEEGPGGLVERFRNHFDPLQATWVGRGLNCPLCEGVWVSLFVACLFPFTTWQTFLLTWWGIAGAQTFLHLGLDKWNG